MKRLNLKKFFQNDENKASLYRCRVSYLGKSENALALLLVDEAPKNVRIVDELYEFTKDIERQARNGEIETYREAWAYTLAKCIELCDKHPCPRA